MSTAPPGISTGRFYIILGYIPRRRTWQELKDFVHQSGFQVVHVQIHTGLHSGWISVDGEDSFWRLGEWLEQAEWDGNRFQVDMRNYDQETPLGPSPHIPLDKVQPVRGSHTVTAAPMLDSMNGNVAYTYPYTAVMQVATTQANACARSGYAVTSLQQYTYGGQATAGYSTAPLQQQLYGIQQGEAATSYQYQYTYLTPTHVTSPSFSQPLYESVGLSIAPRTIRVENRRLHLTRIPGASSDKEIRKRVLVACPSHIPNPIDEIEIPLHPDGRRRGHALILLQTEELAKRVREKLNGMAVRGPDGVKHGLKVKFAQEGATEVRGEDLTVRMEGLNLGSVQGGYDQEQKQTQQQTTQVNGDGNGQSRQQEAFGGETERVEERKRSSLPIANGSLSVPRDSLGSLETGFSSSVVETDAVEGEREVARGETSKVSNERKPKRENKEREREKAGRKVHSHSFSGKSSGGNKRK